MRNIMPLSSRFHSLFHAYLDVFLGNWLGYRGETHLQVTSSQCDKSQLRQYVYWWILISLLQLCWNLSQINKHTSTLLSSLSHSTYVDHIALNAALLWSTQEETGWIISPAAFRQHLVEEPIEWSSTHCESLPLHCVHYCLDLPTDTILPFRHVRCAGVRTTHSLHLFMPSTACFLRWYWMFNIMKLTWAVKAIY
jgi:hypothetical protein